MAVRRYIAAFQKGADSVNHEVALAPVDLEILQEVFGEADTNPMVEVYPLTPERADALNARGLTAHDFRFIDFDYFLYCDAVP